MYNESNIIAIYFPGSQSTWFLMCRITESVVCNSKPFHLCSDMHGSDRRSDLIAGIDKKLKQNIQDLLKHKRQMGDDRNPLGMLSVNKFLKN